MTEEQRPAPGEGDAPAPTPSDAPPDSGSAQGAGISRRGLLAGSGIGLGGLVVGGAAGYFGRGTQTTTVTSGTGAQLLSSGQVAGLRALAPGEAATLEAVLERLLPSDATGPGAKEANVLRYIDWSLADGDGLSAFRAPYSSAITAIDAYSRRKFKGAFTDLSAKQQDEVLADMQGNKAAGFSPDSLAVFTMIRAHALQGMFGDPAHGGNVGYVGWKLIGFPGPRLVISAEDQQINAEPTQQLASTYSNPIFKKTSVDL